MLSNLAITNFFSLRDPAVLDMCAVKSRAFNNSETRENTFIENGMGMIKTVAIFGANASGKSNFIKAIDVCLRIIRDSHSYNEYNTVSYEPFKFDDNIKPSSFEIELFIDNNRYAYGFSIMSNRIVEEHLYYYPKKHRALVFKRETDSSGKTIYDFSKKFSRPKEVVANTSDYTLFLTRAALMNRPEPIKILNFVTNRISVGLPTFDDKRLEILLQNHKGELLNALKFADSDIVDYEFVEQQGREGVKRLITYHRGNPTKPFDFEKEESAGTRRLLQLLVSFVDAADNNKLLIVDELESSMHPQLVKYAVKLFNQSNKAQMIFSTHDLDLLNVDILRPDQIYFVSKDYSNGSSEFYSLADFTDYKTYKNLRRDYEQGRFDAIPILPMI